MKIKTFQYVSALIPYKSLRRFIIRASHFSNVVIDLEDSILDVTSKNRTKLLKEFARENLKNLLQFGFGYEIGIRINGINTKEFEFDIQLLKDLKDLKWKHIILPKIESSIELKRYLDKLIGVNFQEIIICIESVKGLEDLNYILQNSHSELISKVQFGHFDYFLSKGIFPIPNQTDTLFWEICEEIIEKTEANDYTYLHTPLSSLNSSKLMSSVVGKLSATCKNEFGFATISLSQSVCLTELEMGNHEPLVLIESGALDLKEYAKKIKYLFTSNRDRKFSFHHKNQTMQFVPPHEYLAAIKFLENDEN